MWRTVRCDRGDGYAETVDSWTQIADGVFQRRYDPLDVSVVAIVGPTGVVLVDTRNNPAEADEIIADVDTRFALPIVAVINTHAHYDHTFGNQQFASGAHRTVPIYGHAGIPRHFEEFEGPRLAAQQADPSREPDKQWSEVHLTPPSVLIDAPTTVRAGDRTIELIPLPPGHTDTDLVVFIPDQRVWILGDIVEESGPPMYGSGSFPFGWPDALRRLLERVESGDRLIPGHGAVVDRDFVVAQADALQTVADAIRSAWANSLSIDDVFASSSLELPWPETVTRSAFEQGYAQLAGAER
jgi:glyoxylase-like metal-dependent hydrolase (beta-lactamase superfamily II)